MGQRSPSIYYLVPDYDEPSWGVGLMYGHVRLLCRGGFHAFVVHRREPFRPGWIEADLPIRYLDSPSFAPEARDLLVVPEVLVAQGDIPAFDCRRFVFVQGSFLILAGSTEALDYGSLGYEAAIATLPHIREIVHRHFGIEAFVIPPFVAPYFFSDPVVETTPRKRRVLLSAKPEYRKAGYVDYDVVGKLLHRKLAEQRPADELTASRWDMLELEGMTHREVAETMRASTFLVNLNSLEGFNATVPEAMAAGCIPICYEAYGGRDFLSDGENAYVFPNNHIYPLVEKVSDLMDRFDVLGEELERIRQGAYATACRYTEDRTAQELLAFFRARSRGPA